MRSRLAARQTTAEWDAWLKVETLACRRKREGYRGGGRMTARASSHLEVGPSDGSAVTMVRSVRCVRRFRSLSLLHSAIRSTVGATTHARARSRLSSVCRPPTASCCFTLSIAYSARYNSTPVHVPLTKPQPPAIQSFARNTARSMHRCTLCRLTATATKTTTTTTNERTQAIGDGRTSWVVGHAGWSCRSGPCRLSQRAVPATGAMPAVGRSAGRPVGDKKRQTLGIPS